MAYGVGQVQQFKWPTPQEHLANALKLRADQLEIDSRTQEAAAKLRKESEDAQDNAWLTAKAKELVHPDGSPDMVSIGKAAMQYKPLFGMALQEHISKGQQAEAEAVKAKAANERADYEDDIHKLMRAAPDPQSFGIWMPRIKDPALLQAIGNQWDESTPQKIQGIIATGLSQADWLKDQERLAGKYGKDPEGAFLEDVALSRNDADMANAYKALQSHASADVVNHYQQMLGTTLTPEVKALAAEHTKTAVQRSAEANTTADNAARDAAAARQARQDAINNAYRGREVAVSEQNANRLAAEQGAAAGPANVGPIDPNAPRGDDYLKTLPTTQGQMVKALAEGRQPWPSAMALRTPYWQDLMQKVFQYDPTFDTSQASSNARQKVRNDFTSGASAKQINALNTVVGHLGTLAEAGKGLSNTSQPWFNSVKNFIKAGTGSPSVVNFETAKEAVASELVRVWRQAGGAEADIKAWKEQISSSNSPAQLNAAFTQIGHLLESKLESMREQYRQGMGTAAIEVITPEARKALDKLEGVSAPQRPAGVPATAHWDSARRMWVP